MRLSRCLLGAAALAAALPLGSCSHVPDAVNPIAWYRDVAGLSKNDSQDQNQRNEKNLEAGAERPYPNLADVPNAPDRATSGIDRDQLKQSLVADRENAKYSNEQLQAGRQLASAAPPPPPALSPARAPVPGAPAAERQNQTTAERQNQTTAERQNQTAAPTPLASPAAEPQTHAGASPAPQGGQIRGEPAPMESTLQSPAVRAMPEGETPASPPPPAGVLRTAPPPMPVAKPPAAKQQNPTTPPAAAERQTPTPPVRQNQPTLAMRTPAEASSTISVSVGDITFAPGSANLSSAHRGTLSEIAGLYKQAGGKIRVVGHAERVPGGDVVQQRVAMLNLSLDRANAVALALTQMGVPAGEIKIEAAPEKGGQEIPRAEVFMEY